MPITAPRDLMPSLALQALGHIGTYIHTHIYIIKNIKKEEERKGAREDNNRGGQKTFRSILDVRVERGQKMKHNKFKNIYMSK